MPKKEKAPDADEPHKGLFRSDIRIIEFSNKKVKYCPHL